MQFEGARKGKKNPRDRKKKKTIDRSRASRKNQCLSTKKKKRTEEYLPACHLAAACALSAAMTAPASDARARAAAEGALKWAEEDGEDEGGSIDDEAAGGGPAAPGAPAAAAAEAAAAASVVVIAALFSRGKERSRRRNGKRRSARAFLLLFSCASISRLIRFL